MVVYSPSWVLSDGETRFLSGAQSPHRRSGRYAHSADQAASRQMPKKVTFTKLDDTFRVLRAGKITTV
jgi:hypothetical protein